MRARSRAKLGLALSGGTLKAAAHIGVISALERLNIKPDCIAGTSAGSLVCALYAHGYSTPDFVKVIDDFPGIRLLDYGFPLLNSILRWSLFKILHVQGKPFPPAPLGLLRGQKFMDYIGCLIEQREVITPYFVAATDLITGKPVIFHGHPDHRIHQQSVAMTHRARCIAGSCALPGIFSPVQEREFLLVDGAFRHYVPVSVLRDYGCERIIAINLYHLAETYQINSVFDVMMRSFEILLKENIDNDISSSPQVFLLEPNLTQIRWRSFQQMNECVQAGRNIVEENQVKLQMFVQGRPKIDLKRL